MSGVDLFSGAPCRHRGCRASRFYIENGLTYCRRGHLQEGIVQQAADDGFVAGPQGTTTRLEKAPKVNQRRTLPEASARRLYLQTFQVILQKQLYVLATEFGFPPALEDVVLQIWRIKANGTFSETSTVGETHETGDEMVFSSQAFDDNSANESKRLYGRLLSEFIGSGRLPKGADTIAILYVAATSLSLPWTVSDLMTLVELNVLPLVRLNEVLPRNMYQRLPSAMLMRLDCSRMTGEDLMRYICGLRISLYSSCAFKIPEFKYKILAMKSLSALLLPVSFLPAILQLAIRYDGLLEDDVEENRVWWKNCPELCLLAAIVIVVRAKLRGISYEEAGDESAQTVLWEQWSRAVRQVGHDNVINTNTRHRKFGGRQELCALTMIDTEIDEYMDWYTQHMIEEDRVDKRRSTMLPRDIFALFPSGINKKPVSQIDPMANLQRQHDFDRVSRQELRAGVAQAHKRTIPSKIDGRPELERLLMERVAAHGAITSTLMSYVVQFWETRVQ